VIVQDGPAPELCGSYATPLHRTGVTVTCWIIAAAAGDDACPSLQHARHAALPGVPGASMPGCKATTRTRLHPTTDRLRESLLAVCRPLPRGVVNDDVHCRAPLWSVPVCPRLMPSAYEFDIVCARPSLLPSAAAAERGCGPVSCGRGRSQAARCSAHTQRHTADGTQNIRQSYRTSWSSHARPPWLTEAATGPLRVTVWLAVRRTRAGPSPPLSFAS